MPLDARHHVALSFAFVLHLGVFVENQQVRFLDGKSASVVKKVVKIKDTYKSPDEQGYYGKFGGAYIPEMLHRNVEELRSKYLNIVYDEKFQKEFHELLRDYAGRPTPLYFAGRLSEKYGSNIFLKREDLCHTG